MLYFFKDYWGKYELGILAKRPRSGGAAQQTHLFGVLAVSTHNGRATMYCKTKRKAKDAPTEYGIVPLSGITNDDGAKRVQLRSLFSQS